MNEEQMISDVQLISRNHVNDYFILFSIDFAAFSLLKIQ
jgi:hypothetical protein